jgi:DNA repair protein RadC
MYKTIETTILQVCENQDGRRTASPEEAVGICADLSTASQEQFVVLTLDTRSRVIQRHLVSLGTLNSTSVHPREVFRPAVLDAAASIIVVHNHPSGDPSPSSSDIRITKSLVDAGNILQIPVVDHLIIGRKSNGNEGFFSFRDSGLVSFEAK